MVAQEANLARPKDRVYPDLRHDVREEKLAMISPRSVQSHHAASCLLAHKLTRSCAAMQPTASSGQRGATKYGEPKWQNSTPKPFPILNSRPEEKTDRTPGRRPGNALQKSHVGGPAKVACDPRWHRVVRGRLGTLRSRADSAAYFLGPGKWWCSGPADPLIRSPGYVYDQGKRTPMTVWECQRNNVLQNLKDRKRKSEGREQRATPW